MEKAYREQEQKIDRDKGNRGKMDSVSEYTDTSKKSKQDLLQERRAKLAKWKLKKTQTQLKQPTEKSETQSGIPSNDNSITNNTTVDDRKNGEISDDRILQRQKKLQEWKLKKRQRDEAKKQTPVLENPVKKPKKVKHKARRNLIMFDADEGEDNARDSIGLKHNSTKMTDGLSQLFNPLSSEQSMSVGPTMAMDTDNIESDPFEYLMNTLEANETLGNKSVENTHSFDDMFEGDDAAGLSDNDDHDSDEDIEMKNKVKRIERMKKLKTVSNINFDPANLEPIKKTFYQEPEDLKRLSTEEIEELRLSLDNIKVKGKDCPSPVLRWSQLGLNTATMNLIKTIFKFDTLTPIQAQTIPAIMSGRDVIGISKTGSGKTLAYLLPLFRHIKAQRDLSKNETGPIGLIMAPTRELALQINEELLKFAKDDNSVTSICCTGGSEMKRQINDLRRGVKVVVATPGRFIDLLTLNGGKLVNTSRVSFVVLDEADRLFDLGFEPQITQIMRAIRPDKQCILFSATFPNKLKRFAVRVLDNPLSITINSANMVNENVEQNFLICNNDIDKFDTLISTLNIHFRQIDYSKDTNPDEKIIIFVSSQQLCDTLYNKLEGYNHDIFAIHAGKPYQERVTNLNDFKNTPNSILLCTEVLSRGLNVPEVSLVIIYNAIKTFAEYVHTTGRTARGTNHGKALTLLLKDDLAAAYIIKRAMREKELLNHQSDQVKLFCDMNEQFEAGLKNGKYKLLKGFGGKGLENIETQRNEIKDKEISTYYPNDGEELTSSSISNRKDSQSNIPSNSELIIPKLEYTTVMNKEADSSTNFTVKVNVNDLPQLVRWEATKNTTLAFIKNETSCSITTRGKYYPPDKSPQDDKDEPKLYLLIETHDEKNIRLCIELLEEKVKEGIKKVEYQALRSSKF